MTTRLWSALTIDTDKTKRGCSSGWVVTFIGAGGKTSSITRLAVELEQQKLLITTTTNFFRFEGFSHTEFLADSKGEMVERLVSIWDVSPTETIVAGKTIAGKFGSQYKIKGIPPEWIDAVKELFSDLVILVEGDGSAGKPIKAPAPYEPVVPESSDIVAPVLGMSVLGKEIGPDNCHRIEQLQALLPGNKQIGKELIVEILTADRAYGRWKDKGCFYFPILNQVGPENTKHVTDIAREVISRGVDRVLLTSVREEIPVVKIVS